MTRRISSAWVRTSKPATVARPASGLSSVARIRTVVVLPAPFGPSRPRTVPSSTIEVDAVEGADLALPGAVDLHQAFRGDRLGHPMGLLRAPTGRWRRGVVEYTGRPAPRAGARPGRRVRVGSRHPPLPGPDDRRARAIPDRDLARPLGRHPAAPGGRVRRVARVRRAPPGAAAVLHRAGPRLRDARAGGRGLAGGAARLGADLRVARRPHRAGPADGHRAARHRRPRGAAAGVHGRPPVPAAARRLRGRRRDLRPGGPRLPDGRDAAGPPRRGVRAVRRGPDGRPAARPRDRRVRRRPVRRHRLRLRLQRDRGVRGGPRHRPAGPRDAGPDAPGAVARLDRVPARLGVPRPARRERRRCRPRPRPGPDAPDQPLEPRPDRRHRHQRRRVLRGRHLRGHLEHLPAGPRRRASGSSGSRS